MQQRDALTPLSSVQGPLKVLGRSSGKVKQPSVISAVKDPISGKIECSDEKILTAVENHIGKVFNASHSPIPSMSGPKPNITDHGYSKRIGPTPSVNSDHGYHGSPLPCLTDGDGSNSLESDPKGWLDKPFVFDELKKIVKV